MRRNGQRYGGYIVHLGMVMIGVAVIGNQFYVETTNVTLARGESAELVGYTFTYDGMSAERRENLTEYRAFVTILDDDGTRMVGTVAPRRNIYDKAPDMPTSEVGLRMLPTEDLYVVLNGWDENSATFSIFVNPLTVWLWIGGIVLVLGTLIAMWPHPKRRTAPVPAAVGQLA
jgi:cytochrome c-type biogenesis protein CcmF